MTDVLLVHGAGANSAVWAEFELPGFTVHTIDLHSPWTWESMLDQIEELGLDNPAVVGQSLGGALAVRWGKRHPQCPAIVNLDGHGYPSTYPGLSDVDEWRRRLDEVFDQMAETMDPDLLPIRELVAHGTVHELYDGLTCPALIVVAGRIMPVQEPFAEYYEANRKGILADLAGRKDVVEFDASHNMVAERPRELAAIVTRFLREKAG
jgi:pimeloyl-ACP methyl ester carboxylesterase